MIGYLKGGIAHLKHPGECLRIEDMQRSSRLGVPQGGPPTWFKNDR